MVPRRSDLLLHPLRDALSGGVAELLLEFIGRGLRLEENGSDAVEEACEWAEQRVGSVDGGRRDRQETWIPRKSLPESFRIVLLQRFQGERLVQRPDLARRTGVASRDED